MTLIDEAETTDRDSADPSAALMAGAARDALGLKREDLDVMLRVAKATLDRDADADALRLYSTVLLCEPTHLEGLIGAAVCGLRLHTPDLALQAASAAVALAPKDPRGYLLSGRACLALDHPKEAREDFEAARRVAVEARAADVAAEAHRFLAALSGGPG